MNAQQAPYAPLHVLSAYSFLRSLPTPAELISAAAHLGLPAIALTDRMNVSGALEFQKLAQAAGIHPIQGAEMVVAAPPDAPAEILTVLACGPEGYANLCRLLTRAHLESPRLHPCLPRQAAPDVSPELWQNLIVLSGGRDSPISHQLLQGNAPAALSLACRYREALPAGHFYLELDHRRLPRARWLNQQLTQLAERTHLPLVAASPVHYRSPEDFPLYDILTCIRTGTTLDQVHPERPLNPAAFLLSPKQMYEQFADYPDAIAATLAVAARCQPAFDLSRTHFPRFPLPPGAPSAAHLLRQLVAAGAQRRYGSISAPLAARIDHELEIITRLGVEDYFLVVWDLAEYARRCGIRAAGRGSAADSVVAYCLGLTEVDAFQRGLLFERFLSLERAQKPDIDIDFAAEYRDQVAAYAYEKYGSEHVASVCTFSTFQARSALREVGKVLGFGDDELGSLAKRFPHVPADAIRQAVHQLPELRKSGLPWARYQLLFSLAEQLAGRPRFIGTHLGGIVISRDPIVQLSPLQQAAKGVTIIQFDKDAVEDLGLIKLDLLSLRTLSALEQAVVSLKAHQPTFAEGRIPDADPATYQRLQQGETVGIFQLESPAQRALQARLHADRFEDLVASVALIRPGPIKGNMVEPYLARRHGQEPITYLLPELEPILAKTYGVVLFQEQVIEIATQVAGFTPGEADRLRRVMTHFRSQKEMEAIGKEFIAKAIARGISPPVAQTVFSYVLGYAGYGFCEAHAAAFANTAYKTAYLVEHYPAHFFAALLSQQPMGYWPPHALVVEAARRGVPTLNPDINTSDGWRFTVVGEKSPAILPSLMQIDGLKAAGIRQILAARQQGQFQSVTDFISRVELDRDVLANLVLAGVFDALALPRRQILWQLPTLLAARPTHWHKPHQQGKGTGADLVQLALPLQHGMEQRGQSQQQETEFPPLEKSLREWAVLGFSPSGHPLTFLRPQLAEAGYLSSTQIQQQPEGTVVLTAGVLIRPHRPPTRSGKTVVFFTLEDEEGLTDLTAFPATYERYGQVLFGSRPLLQVKGRVQRRGERAAVIAGQIAPLAGVPPTARSAAAASKLLRTNGPAAT